jgi:hypothetical protein
MILQRLSGGFEWFGETEKAGIFKQHKVKPQGRSKGMLNRKY